MNDVGAWKSAGRSSAKAIQQQELTAANVMRLGNGLHYRELPEPVTGSITLRLDVLHENSRRGTTVWLTDAAGRRGYGFLGIRPGPSNTTAAGASPCSSSTGRRRWPGTPGQR